MTTRCLALPALLALVCPLALASACAVPAEGDDPGECEDGADNDADGLFDCDDDNCSGAPACGESDTDTDTDTDTDSDSDSDSDSDTDTELPSVAIAAFAKTAPGCDDHDVRAKFFYENISAGSGRAELEAIASGAASWASTMIRAEPGDAVVYSYQYSADCIGGGGNSDNPSWLAEADQMLIVYADGTSKQASATLWTAGVDFSKDEVIVAFEDETTVDYAESILATQALEVVVQTNETPPAFLVRASEGQNSLSLVLALQGQSRVSYAMPSTE